MYSKYIIAQFVASSSLLNAITFQCHDNFIIAFLSTRKTNHTIIFFIVYVSRAIIIVPPPNISKSYLFINFYHLSVLELLVCNLVVKFCGDTVIVDLGAVLLLALLIVLSVDCDKVCVTPIVANDWKLGDDGTDGEGCFSTLTFDSVVKTGIFCIRLGSTDTGRGEVRIVKSWGEDGVDEECVLSCNLGLRKGELGAE